MVVVVDVVVLRRRGGFGVVHRDVLVVVVVEDLQSVSRVGNNWLLRRPPRPHWYLPCLAVPSRGAVVAPLPLLAAAAAAERSEDHADDQNSKNQPHRNLLSTKVH